METNHNGCDKTESEDNMDKDDTDGSIAFSALEVYWRIYHGGIESSIRSQVNDVDCYLDFFWYI